MIYSDKTFFAWDIKQLNNVHIYRNNIFNSGGIKAIIIIYLKKKMLLKSRSVITVILWYIWILN